MIWERNIFKSFLIGLLCLSLVLTPTILGAKDTHANMSKSKNEKEYLKIIADTNETLIYTVDNGDGSIYQYEETSKDQGDKTIIYTKIYDITNNKKLINEFTTEILENNGIIEINKYTNNGKENVLINENKLLENAKESVKNMEYSILNDNWNWTKASMISGGFGYYTIYSIPYGGNAAYTSMRKLNLYRGSTYDEFVKEVNSLISKESSILKDATGVALLQAIKDIGTKGITLGTVLNLIKRIGAPAALAYSGFQWALNVNRCQDIWYRL